MRYDLAFFLCCCKSFLGDHKRNNNTRKGRRGGDNGGEDDTEQFDPSTSSFDEEQSLDFYQLLGVERDATPDELKKAYKRQSLQMHPDKLAQRGITLTERHQARFTRMKEAYEVLSDPHKRETYDAIGERGLKWLEEPFSIDPQELAHNFATSSVLDRSKIFMIFVAIAVAVLALPVLVCLKVDGEFGNNRDGDNDNADGGGDGNGSSGGGGGGASWFAILTPLWLWDAFILFYHVRVIMMGPIPRPEHIPAEEWVDPLPMKKRVFSCARFALIVLFEILVVCKLDGVAGMRSIPWFVIFSPLYVWEFTTLYKKWPIAKMRIVTIEDLEIALGKPFQQFTQAEKELIGRRYSVVPSIHSPEFDTATKLKQRARHDILKSGFRIVFCALLLAQMDFQLHLNWFVVFLPFWVVTVLICYANYQAFVEVQSHALQKDPTLFGSVPNGVGMGGGMGGGDVETGGGGGGGGAGGATADGGGTTPTTGYGAVGMDGTAPAPNQQQKPGQEQTPPSPLTDQEREELKAQVMASSSRLCSKCCSQGFLVFVMLLFVAKLQGAGFSSIWIISPFLFAAGIILCCLGCAIFGITEVPTDGLDFDTGDFVPAGDGDGMHGGGLGGFGARTGTAATPIYVPPPPRPSSSAAAAAAPPIIIPPPPSSQSDNNTRTLIQQHLNNSSMTDHRMNDILSGQSSVPVGGGGVIPNDGEPSSPPSAAVVDLLDDNGTRTSSSQQVVQPPVPPSQSPVNELHDLD